MRSIETTLDVPIDEAEDRVRDALAEQGFGVLTEIDVAATLHAKLGVERPPLKILGACNPQLRPPGAADRPLGRAPPPVQRRAGSHRDRHPHLGRGSPRADDRSRVRVAGRASRRPAHRGTRRARRRRRRERAHEAPRAWQLVAPCSCSSPHAAA